LPIPLEILWRTPVVISFRFCVFEQVQGLIQWSNTVA
jgi:hypothetical protein